VTDTEARLQALERSVLILAEAVRSLQVHFILESSLTNVRLCERATQHAILEENVATMGSQSIEGFSAVTMALKAVMRRLSDGDDGWRSDATDF
jgi:hypothetical protein